MKFFRFLLFLSLFTTVVHAQVYPIPEITWVKCYGGTGGDSFYDTQKTPDGGYISVGESTSNDYDLTGVCCPELPPSLWLIKLDSNYNIQWQKLLQAIPTDVRIDCWIFPNSNQTYTLFETIDDDGEAPLCSCNHSTSQDIWMFIVDNTGAILSQKCYGGSAYDLMGNVSRCEDGGYIIGASSGSVDGDVGIHYGSSFTTDAFIVKTDSLGNIQWTKTLGGTGFDGATVAGISGNRCLINIGTWSNDYDMNGIMPPGETMMNWIMITDSSGNIINDTLIRAYGGKLDLNYPYEYQNNKYLLVGLNAIDTGIFIENNGPFDAVIAAFNSSLSHVDYFQFGGSETDDFSKMIKLNDTTLYFTGRTYSSDYDAQPIHGDGEENDNFIVKTDTMFNKIWSKSFGASGGDKITNIIQKDSAIILFGASGVYADEDGDILNAHYSDEANGEGWAMILNENVPIDSGTLIPGINIYPNPANNNVLIEINADDGVNYILFVYSLEGKKVLTRNLSNLSINEIEIKSLSSGYYLFTIMDGNNKILKTDKIFIY